MLKALRALALAALLVAPICAVGALAGPLPAAWAHAELIGVTPADGAGLSAVPAVAVLTFSDPIDGKFIRAAVRGPGGTVIVPASAQGRIVTVPVSAQGAGAYTVSYRVVSADGHPVSGAVHFTVAGPLTANVSPDTSASSALASSSAGPASESPPVATDLPLAALPGTSVARAGAGSSWLLIGGLAGLVVIAVAGALMLALGARRRRSSQR